MGDSSDRRGLYAKYSVAALAALVAFAVYLPSLRNGFVNWDDMQYVYENPHIVSLNLKLFRWAFLDFYAANWHPLTWLSLSLDYAVWGLKPFGYHLTNILLHAGNTFLVVVLTAKLLDAGKEAAGNDRAVFRGRSATWLIAGVTGLLFGLHPLHVESVAWVSERKDLLCALFFLLSILSYVSCRSDAARTPHNRHYFSAVVFFLLALLSKPMAVSLPFVLLILDWYPFRRIGSLQTFRAAFAEKIPFFALSVFSSMLTIMAQKSVGAIASAEFMPLGARLLVAANSLIAYLRKMVLPFNLLPYYPYPKDISLLSFKYLFSVIGVIGFTAACVIVARKQRLWLAVWGYYVVTLLPVLGIVQVGSQSMADRYAYLPSVGPFLVAGVFAAWLVKAPGERRALLFRSVGVVTAFSLFVLLSYLTVKQTGIWKDGISLWNFAIEKEGNVAILFNNRGYAFQERGQIDKAVADFDEAVALNPAYAEAYNNRGLAFYKMGMFDKAIADYDRVIALDPSHYQAYNNRGLIFSRMGLFEKAIADYDRVIALDPSFSTVYFNKGVVFGKVGSFDKAIEYLGKAVALNPYYYDAYFNRGLVYSAIGQYGRALDDFSKTIELNPNYAAVYFYRGNLYLKKSNIESAVADFQRACALRNASGCEALKSYGPALPNVNKTP